MFVGAILFMIRWRFRFYFSLVCTFVYFSDCIIGINMFYSKIDNHQVKKLILTGKPPKKNVKKLHTLCELSQKIRDPPSPYFTTISATFWTWKSKFFAIMKSLWIRGIDLKMFLLFLRINQNYWFTKNILKFDFLPRLIFPFPYSNKWCITPYN